MTTRLSALVCASLLASGVAAQTVSPQRYISPLDCDDRGRVGTINVVEIGDTIFCMFLVKFATPAPNPAAGSSYIGRWEPALRAGFAAFVLCRR